MNETTEQSFYEAVGGEGMRRLREFDRFPALQTLDLGFTNLGAGGVQTLARAPALPRLRRVNLVGNKITAPGAKSLAHSPLVAEAKPLRSAPP